MGADESVDNQWYIEDNRRWPYDKFVRTYFVKPLQYRWVRQRHDRTLVDLRQSVIEPFESRARHLPTVLKLEQAGFQGLFEFLDAVSTQDQAERLMQQTGIDRDDMETWLDFVKRRWFIPPLVQLRQLFDTSDRRALSILKRSKSTRWPTAMLSWREGEPRLAEKRWRRRRAFRRP